MGSERVSLEDRVAGDQHIGAREHQEDSYAVVDLRDRDSNFEDSALIVVADGMGGHVGGAIASDIAVRYFKDAFLESDQYADIGRRLSFALEAATKGLSQAIEDKPDLRGMGCTIVAVLLHDDCVNWLSVGDSPFWLFRNGALTRLNEDHSMKPVLATMVEKGELTKEEAENDGRANALRSALDGNPPELVNLKTDGYVLQPGDMLLAATDGLETLSEDQIAYKLNAYNDKPVQERLRALLDDVMKLGSPYQDNVTAVLMDPVLSGKGLSATSKKTQLLRSGSVNARSAAPQEGGDNDAEYAHAPTQRPHVQRLWFIGAIASFLVLCAVGVLFLMLGGDDGNQIIEGPQDGVPAHEDVVDAEGRLEAAPDPLVGYEAALEKPVTGVAADDESGELPSTEEAPQDGQAVDQDIEVETGHDER